MTEKPKTTPAFEKHDKRVKLLALAQHFNSRNTERVANIMQH